MRYLRKIAFAGNAATTVCGVIAAAITEILFMVLFKKRGRYGKTKIIKTGKTTKI